MNDEISRFRTMLMESRELLFLTGHRDMSDPDQPYVAFTGSKEWQEQVDYLWNMWRRSFPYNGPPPRPRQIRTRQDIQDAIDSLLRALPPDESTAWAAPCDSGSGQPASEKDAGQKTESKGLFGTSKIARNDGGEEMADGVTRSNRADLRNQEWLKWYNAEGEATHQKPAKIREKWNAMSDANRRQIDPRFFQVVTREVVKKGIAQAKESLTDTRIDE